MVPSYSDRLAIMVARGLSKVIQLTSDVSPSMGCPLSTFWPSRTVAGSHRDAVTTIFREIRYCWMNRWEEFVS